MKGMKVKSYICNSSSPMACSLVLKEMGWSSAFFMHNDLSTQKTGSLIVSNSDLTTGDSLLTNEVWCSDAESLKDMESMEEGVVIAFEAELDKIPSNDVWDVDEPNLDEGVKWIVQDRFWSNSDEIEFTVPDILSDSILNYGPEVFGNPKISALPIGEHQVNFKSPLMNGIMSDDGEVSISDPEIIHVFSHIASVPAEVTWANDNMGLEGSFVVEGLSHNEELGTMSIKVNSHSDLSPMECLTLMCSIENGSLSVDGHSMTIEDGYIDGGEHSICSNSEKILCFLAIFKSTVFFFHGTSHHSDVHVLSNTLDYIIVNGDEEKVIDLAKEHMESIGLASSPGCLNVPLTPEVIFSARKRLDEGLFDENSLIGDLTNCVHLLESHGFIMESLRVAEIINAMNNGYDLEDYIKNDEFVLKEFMEILAEIVEIDIGSGWMKEDFKSQFEHRVRYLMANVTSMLRVGMEDYIESSGAMSDLGTSAFIELNNALVMHDKLEYACDLLDIDFIYPSKDDIEKFTIMFLREMSNILDIPLFEYRKLLTILVMVARSRLDNYFIMDDDVALEHLDKIQKVITSYPDEVNLTTNEYDDDNYMDNVIKFIDLSRELIKGSSDSYVNMVTSTFGEDSEEDAFIDFCKKKSISVDMATVRSLMESSDVDMTYAVETMENGGGLIPLLAIVASQEGEDTLEANTLKDVVFDIMDSSISDELVEKGFIDSPFLVGTGEDMDD